ncbi:oxidoreductase [Actinopolymorpha rutila]|uniref:NAD(P)-dependent dehydrogenase (Short-subunit alcohol dehydrogenase family) n=1 Tax=Actinopolymorpha rutila TaxID=446787 RepID=A0A852Z4X7_9ACTN|nr:oxidoreductase [Actinopolymorpha rutila]NYH87881.1 NAD(P)-dependent dehydrogenase (short-subunit alcohol dehydrogenase family) [Actinopolymorpha rutila]
MTTPSEHTAGSGRAADAKTTAVLITGTSSGIGRAAALRLARRPDLTVYATARRTDSIADLAAAGAHVLALDVTDEASMRAAVEEVEAAHGFVGALVNNAGYGAYGTVEETDLDAVRRQFETNVFGLARMAQLVLPGMRRAGRGRIVNVGSMGGRLVFPVGGYYHASKYAVEALTDALRFEAAPFGVRVSLVEPGLIRTGFAATASGNLAGQAAPSGPYSALNQSAEHQMAQGYRSPLLSARPEAVARVIDHAVTNSRPRTRYVVTPAAKLLVHTRRLLGGRAFDAILRTQFRTA